MHSLYEPTFNNWNNVSNLLSVKKMYRYTPKQEERDARIFRRMNTPFDLHILQIKILL